MVWPRHRANISVISDVSRSGMCGAWGGSCDGEGRGASPRLASAFSEPRGSPQVLCEEKPHFFCGLPVCAAEEGGAGQETGTVLLI